MRSGGRGRGDHGAHNTHTHTLRLPPSAAGRRPAGQPVQTLRRVHARPAQAHARLAQKGGLACTRHARPACRACMQGRLLACTGARKVCTKRRPCIHTACKALHAGPPSCLHRRTQGLHKKAALHTACRACTRHARPCMQGRLLAVFGANTGRTTAGRPAQTCKVAFAQAEPARSAGPSHAHTAAAAAVGRRAATRTRWTMPEHCPVNARASPPMVCRTNVTLGRMPRPRV